MKPNSRAETPDHSDPAHSGPAHYVKIWAVLLVLLAISIAGPTLGIREVTLFTAFGIALIKAWLVATEFMHLKHEKRYIAYLFLGMIFFMFIFFYGVAPDVMAPSGQNWERVPVEIHLPPIVGETEAGAESR